jgi:hypothetical protein
MTTDQWTPRLEALPEILLRFWSGVADGHIARRQAGTDLTHPLPFIRLSQPRCR